MEKSKYFESTVIPTHTEERLNDIAASVGKASVLGQVNRNFGNTRKAEVWFAEAQVHSSRAREIINGYSIDVKWQYRQRSKRLSMDIARSVIYNSLCLKNDCNECSVG